MSGENAKYAKITKNTKILGRFFAYFVIFACFAFAPSLSATQVEEKININTADAQELARLPGIGPALAERIVEHRSRHGNFKRTQDIIIVRGMSAKRYRKISHLIRI